jgi:hypothetical protein
MGRKCQNKFNLRVPTLFICCHQYTRCAGALMEQTNLEYYFVTLRHTTIVKEFINDSKQMGQILERHSLKISPIGLALYTKLFFTPCLI